MALFWPLTQRPVERQRCVIRSIFPQIVFAGGVLAHFLEGWRSEVVPSSRCVLQKALYLRVTFTGSKLLPCALSRERVWFGSLGRRFWYETFNPRSTAFHTVNCLRADKPSTPFFSLSRSAKLCFPVCSKKPAPMGNLDNFVIITQSSEQTTGLGRERGANYLVINIGG